MLKDRNLRLDLFAVGLLALVVFLLLALATYETADPPSRMVFPPRETVHNACGRAGALVAHTLLASLGVGAYLLVASLAALGVWMLRRRPIDQPWLRGAGWLLALVALSTLAAMALPGVSAGPVVGPGGYVGAAGLAMLKLHFATAGAFILTLSVLVTGLLLSTDYFLFQMLAKTVHFAGDGLNVLRRPVWPGKPSEADDEFEEEADEWQEEEDSAAEEEAAEDGDEEEDGEDQPHLRIRVRTGEEEEDAAEQESAAENQPSLRSRVASALKIRRPKKYDNSQRDEVMEKLDAAAQSDAGVDYELPSVELLLPGEEIPFEQHERECRRNAKILERTFGSFGFQVRVVEIDTGPVIAQYEIELEAGLRLSKITGLADDLAIALRVPSVRIVAPIPGKNTVGIEVPNKTRQLVRLREVMEETDGRVKRLKIPIFLGKDVSGAPMVVDLATMPHLLIAGRTGTGKSVCLNSIITSVLMTRRPDEVRMLMIDPKMVELSPYKSLPHLMHPVVTDMKKAEAILAWAVDKMEERYALLARAGVRHLSSYNQLGDEELLERFQPENEEERKAIPTTMPFIVVVADEIADMMMTAGKEVEQHIIRLAQKSRAVGIHLILATQKPTVDVITGLIKSNLPARICFQVSSRTDSRVVLDEMGADKLLGNGDMLFLQPGTSILARGQGTYLSDDEINKVIDAVSVSEPQFVQELVSLKPKDEQGGPTGKLKNRDDLYEAAVDIVVREGRGSVSLLQRTLGIGYGRAARLIDYMAEDGIVGEYNGSQAREILITLAEWEAMIGEEPSEEEPKPMQGRKILPAPAAGTTTEKTPLSSRPLEDAAGDDDDFEEEDRSLSGAVDDAYGAEAEEEPPFDVAGDEDEDYASEEEAEHEDDEYEYEYVYEDEEDAA